MRVFRIALWVVGAWLIIGTISFIAYPWFRAHNAFVESKYNFKIEGIEFRPGHRGTPHIKTPSGWYLLRTNDEMKMVPYIQVGDSIVKEQGSSTIKVYRTDRGGNVIVREFE